MTCVFTDCQGEVKFGARRDWHYCRKHEGFYLLDEEARTEDTLRKLTGQIGVREDGCWQFEQVWGEGIARPTLKSAGLKWQVARYLYVYFWGGHKGGLELGHICHQEWCVNPGHLEPLTGARNRKDRDVLNKPTEDMTPKEMHRARSLAVEAMVIGVIPRIPEDPTGASELERFAGALSPATPIPQLGPVPEPVVAARTKPEVSLFITDRDMTDQPTRGRRRIAV